jgi:hypothetical protein
MIITNRPELSPEEKKLPIAKYYDLPLYPPDPRAQQIIDNCPINTEYAIKVENFLDLLKPTGYDKAELGCCIMPDGSGYIAAYTIYPECTPKMLGWWFRWLNVHSKGMPAGKGNLKYKIWNPVDHIDHGFVNGKDKTDGIIQMEALDMGKGEDAFYSIRHPFDLKDYGLTEKREKELNATGCFLDCAVEKFYTVTEPHELLPGTHLTLTLSRFCPLGGMEKRTREWIGYGVKDGKIYFDKSTPSYMFTLGYMKNVLIHNTIEAQRLNRILPELYADYKDKPDDEW